MKKQKPNPPFANEWDLSQGMGILPDNVPFTQNIGCVGGKSTKSKKPDSESKKPDSEKKTNSTTI